MENLSAKPRHFRRFYTQKSRHRFEPRRYPAAQSCEELLAFCKTLEDKVKEARDSAIQEFLDIEDAYEGTPEEELVAQIAEEISDPTAFDSHWTLAGVTRSDSGHYLWSLEFDVAWDPEHTRSAYYDSEGAFFAYGLTCAEPSWDDED